MHIENDLWILDDGGAHRIQDSDIDGLIQGGLLKIASIAVSNSAGVAIPSTVIVMVANKNNIAKAVEILGIPLLVRVDYRQLPAKKVLGGIPIETIESLYEVVTYLTDSGYYPLLQQNISRFENQYSVGMAMQRGSRECLVEAVGSGFDASDLRLGSAHPHEYFEIDVDREAIGNSHVIEPGEYSSERLRRIEKTEKLIQYVEYANQQQKMTDTIDMFSMERRQEVDIELHPPERYQSIPLSYKKALVRIAQKLLYIAVPRLPMSESYIASLSFNRQARWRLWDIYGGWYNR